MFRDFIRNVRKNLTFHDLVPVILLLLLVVLGIFGIIYFTPMLSHIDWSGVYVH